jgi:thiosulfate/3-mercaptopyruvate sulfurtransferase
MSLKESVELRKLYAALDPAKETIVMCQSGVRAAQTASGLQDLGFRNVKVYDSSWLGYAARLDAPAENEVFLNVGQMNQRLRELARRVDDLERQLPQQGQPATCINC